LSIPAYLTLPPDSDGKALPLVVLPHGGPEGRDWPHFDWRAQFLATRGYAVLQPQFRGSTGFGNQFRLAGRREWGALRQSDLTDGVKYLIEQGRPIRAASASSVRATAGTPRSPARHSRRKSTPAPRASTAYPTLRRCSNGSSCVAAGNQTSSATGANPSGHAWDPKLGASSPLNAVQRVSAPVLIIYSSEDTVVAPSQSEQLAHALKQSGKTVTLVKLSGDDHWLSRSETRVRMLKEVDGFLAAPLRK
jgi:dipeptidyl aminopeptidase/acylaminoacyl peptidase